MRKPLLEIEAQTEQGEFIVVVHAQQQAARYKVGGACPMCRFLGDLPSADEQDVMTGRFLSSHGRVTFLGPVVKVKMIRVELSWPMPSGKRRIRV